MSSPEKGHSIVGNAVSQIQRTSGIPRQISNQRRYRDSTSQPLVAALLEACSSYQFREQNSSSLIELETLLGHASSWTYQGQGHVRSYAPKSLNSSYPQFSWRTFFGHENLALTMFLIQFHICMDPEIPRKHNSYRSFPPHIEASVSGWLLCPRNAPALIFSLVSATSPLGRLRLVWILEHLGAQDADGPQFTPSKLLYFF